jgi:hypothetical protein
MSEQKSYAAYFLVAPFVIFPVLYFAPWWISAPVTLVGGMVWFGCLLAMGEGKA